MYFKRLEIFGFKSFAEKTVLKFEPGVTAIVGPNGCGKSNIFDSIRWVLGEQSIKELRGSSREDVIFNGTDKKSPLGMAEVNVVFGNESRRFPYDEDEVMITRRLYRSGESEYLLNNRTARLKDIQHMLMGTGIGATAYSLVQQGKVDLVVSAKPQERRSIFDEASGITKYKAKKKEALSKLKSTDDNLLRVNDIVTEVKRQIASIERQANKARKYKENYEKLKRIEVAIARHQIENYEEKKEDITYKLESLKERQEQGEQQLEEMTSQLTREINYLSEVEHKINKIYAQEIKLDGEINVDEGQVRFNEERVANLSDNDRKLVEQKEQLIEKCLVQQQKVEGFKQNLLTLRKIIQTNQEQLVQKKGRLTILERSLDEANAKIKEHEEKVLELTSFEVKVRNDLTDNMKKTQGGLARKRRLELETEKVLLEKEEVDQKITAVMGKVDHVQTVTREIKVDKEQKMLIYEETKTELDRLTESMNRLEKKRFFLESQKEFIGKMNTQYEGMSEDMIEGKIITAAVPLEHQTGIIGKVKKIGRVKKSGFRLFSRIFSKLGPKQLFEIICETKFIELDPEQILRKIDAISSEIDVLDLKRKGVEENLNQQQIALEKLDDQLRDEEKAFSILESQKTGMLTEIEKLTQELKVIDIELPEVNVFVTEQKRKEEELKCQLDTIVQDLRWCEEDTKEKRTWITEKSEEKEDVTVSITRLKTELESAQDKLQSEQDNQSMFADTLDGWLEEMKGIDDEISGQITKKESFCEEIDALSEKIDAIKGQKELLRSASREQKSLKEELDRKINSIRVNISAIEDEVGEIKTLWHNQQLSEQELGFSEKGIKDRLMQTYNIDMDTYIPLGGAKEQGSLPQGEQQNDPGLDDQESSPDFLKEEAEKIEEAETAQESLTETQRLLEFKPDEIRRLQIPDDFAIDTATEERDKLRRRCDLFGTVNLVAIEESQELKQRFEFLTKQQIDLIESRSQLMSTINKINRSTRQMFMDTFTKVGEEFRVYFRTLFGGGDAELVLLDPENVLESGIDIVARPPGKKLQNISLMSGGEKTLTAIALIFGVFKVNPSPLCVLDEIDASLDESNVGRFAYLLQEFVKIAQFIVITHNKKTISSSNIMYGITMPEAGISRIVSVKFAEGCTQEQRKEVPVAV